ncbi:MAG: protein kinase, partial [Magnetococcales bacterium]|nr:protein kinase [Magnetococcales bacterium]
MSYSLQFPGFDLPALPLDRPRTLVGRAVMCHLRLPFDGVEEHHADLVWEGGRLFLHPVSGDSLVNGQRVDREYPLRKGDRLTFGPVVARVEENPDANKDAESGGTSLFQAPASFPQAAPPEESGGTALFRPPTSAHLASPPPSRPPVTEEEETLIERPRPTGSAAPSAAPPSPTSGRAAPSASRPATTAGPAHSAPRTGVNQALPPEIPGYRIERPLGRGGMAVVYLAVQESLDRRTALKVLGESFNQDESFTERFLKEGRTLAGLNHSNIVPVYDIGKVGASHYLAMEYIGGGDLKSRIRRGLGELEAVEILAQMAQALGFAHSKGIVHRDVKPENLMFREDGTAVLTDFGIAKTVTSATHLTQLGMSIGTPHYMSPEQARGLTVDGRSDLYSLGIIFHQMLTGRVPFDATDSFAIALKQINDPIPQLPPEKAHLQPVLERLLAKNPEDRFARAEELILALEASEGVALGRRTGLHRAVGAGETFHPTAARPALTGAMTAAQASLPASPPPLPTPPPPAAPGASRLPMLLAAGALLLAAGGGGVYVWMRPATPPVTAALTPPP